MLSLSLRFTTKGQQFCRSGNLSDAALDVRHFPDDLPQSRQGSRIVESRQLSFQLHRHNTERCQQQWAVGLEQSTCRGIVPGQKRFHLFERCSCADRVGRQVA